MKINTTVVAISKAIADASNKRGAKSSGYLTLQDYGLLAHPEKLARITLGQIYSGSKVANTAVRIGQAVDPDFLWRAQFDIGLFLITCAINSGQYEVRRSTGDAPASAHSREPYYIYAVGSPQKQRQGYLRTEPFAPWISSRDDEGRSILGSYDYTPNVEPDAPWVKAINRLESVAYRINPSVLRLVKKHREIPQDAVKADQQAQIVATAQGLKGSEFYHRGHFDERGRLYISRSDINFQQGDLSRGLIEFARGVRLTKKGLDAIYLHIANCCGEKGDIRERIRWAKDQHKRWLSIKPKDWLQADEPWQLIRACIELKNVKVGELSHLIVPIDQSNSGLAWQAMMMHDEELATLTNLKGGSHDLYAEIAKGLDTLDGFSDGEKRNIIKKSIMPRSYGAGANTIAEQLCEWAKNNPNKAPSLNKLDLEVRSVVRSDGTTIKRSPKEITKIANEAIKALKSEAPASEEYSRRVKAFYKSRLERLDHVQWLSPSGFLCRTKSEFTDKVEGFLRPDGANRIKIVAHERNGKPDTNQMIQSSLANIIHSLDASLVHLILAGTKCDLVTVHDSFGVHPSNIFKIQKTLMSILRKIDESDVSLAIEAQDHPENVIWADLKAVRMMNDWVLATQFPKRAPLPPEGAFDYNKDHTVVVDSTATNVFS